MQSRTRRFVRGLGLLGAGAFLLQAGTTCTSFAAESLLVQTDFCFIFDCQNGLFGGTVDPCTGIGSGDSTVEAQNQQPFFADCPVNN